MDAHHQGRVPLSRPLRSRFSDHRVAAPTVASLKALLLRQIRGVHAGITLRDARYREPTDANPTLRELAYLEGLTDDRLGALAKYTFDLGERTKEKVIGAMRRERYVVDRRRMDRFLDDLKVGVRDELDPGDGPGRGWPTWP